MNYMVTVWRESEGGWSASAQGVDGAFTTGDSLAEVERNIRESIAVTLDLPRGAEAEMGIEFHVRVDDAIDQLVSETVAARTAAKRAQLLTSDAVHRLRSRNVSVRDIAKILDITAGRVAQIDKGRAAA